MQQERSAQWSFIVLLSSVMLPGGVSGGLASGGTCQAVRVWTVASWTDVGVMGLRADDTPNTLQYSVDTRERKRAARV